MNVNVINGIDLTEHLGLIGLAVRQSAGRDVGAALEHQDLFQAGFYGLRRAAQKFDPNRGCRFSTYAMHWIRHHVQRTIANQSRTIRVPIWAQERGRRSGYRVPPPALSLDASSRGDADGRALLETLADDSDPSGELQSTQRRQVLESALEQLPARLRDVLVSRFFKDESLAEIGRRLDLSRERIRQLEAEGLRLLRQELQEEP